MSNGILSRIPDLSGILDSAGRLERDIDELATVFATLDTEAADSPVAAVTSAMAGLSDTLDIDLSGLSERLPGAVTNLRNALPANTLAFVDSLGDSYAGAQAFLQNSDLVRQIGEGQSLQEAALAFLADALGAFDSRLSDLAGNVIDPAALETIRNAISALEQFQADFSANQAEFLPFVTNYLMGVGPDLLQAPLAHVQASLAVLGPLEPEVVTGSLAPIQTQLSDAFAALVSAIETLDAADPAAYAQIQLRLDEIEAASNLMFTALAALYQQVQNAIESHAWDTIFSTYVSLLEAISIGDVVTLDDIIAAIIEMLEDLQARAAMALGAEELRDRMADLTQSMRDAVLGSPLAQIRPTLSGFLGEIREAIEGIPTEAVQQLVEQMLGRVAAELASLNLSELEAEIEAAFQAVDTFIEANLDEGLKDTVRDALNELAGLVERLPAISLLSELTTATAQVEVLIGELESAVQGELDALDGLLSQLETLSFRPVSDEVVAEIDELKARLQAINPNALSDPEKLAITAALAVLQAIDLKGTVAVSLTDLYGEAEAGIRLLLNQITAALNRLREGIGGFSPDVILRPAVGLLDEAAAQVKQLNGQTLLAPLYQQLDALEARLASMSPGQLLDPLQGPYDALMGAVDRLDPNTWVAPLEALYTEVDRLVDLIDITPLLDELDRRQRELFADARNGILAAFDSLDLPEPLDGFLAQLRPVVELMTDAIFGDPDTELRNLVVEFRSRVDLTSLFAPLDEAFLPLIQVVEAAPAAELTGVMNTIRQSLGVGLEVLDPQGIEGQLRNGFGRLAALAPTNLLGATLNLPTLKLAFETQAAGAPPEREADTLAVSARFEAVLSVVGPEVATGQMRQLIATHHAAKEALRLRINELDRSSASENYAQLRRNLDRLLPDFLRQPRPLTHADVVAGIHAMRPSAKAGVFEEAVERLLRQIEPMASTVEPAFNGFFDLLREIMVMINPLAIRDEVDAIYETLREKLRILDPEALTAAIEPILANLTAPLDAMNPAQIKARIDASFQNALAALRGTVQQVLDEVVAILNTQLRAIREAILALIEQVKAVLAGAAGSVEAILRRLEDLVFVGILARLGQVIENLGLSFDAELRRVLNAFDAMLAAIPLDSGAGASIAA